MTQLQDSILQLVNTALENSTGTFSHTGDYNINGTLTVDTINVKNLITEPTGTSEVGNWNSILENDLAGKGFTWSWGQGSTQLAYRSGGRLWTNGIIDIAATSSYSIDNIPVLTASSLGGAVVNSNLTSVGTLRSLSVSGNASFAEFLFVNSMSNRIGVGTEEPNLSLSIVDNSVELGMGSPQIGLGSIGTFSSHDLAITTDNIPRITIKNTGAVNIGDPVNGGGSLNVYGTLFATNIQTDNRIDRTQPLTFNATADTSVYGLGLVWSGTGSPKQLIMLAQPDRIWTTESFDIGANQSYYINGNVAINSMGLGPSIINSNLQKVGVLSSLEVSGTTTLGATTATSITLANTDSVLAITNTGLTANNKNLLQFNANQTTIGDVAIQTHPVKVFGPLSININNPDPKVQFSVNGDVNIGGKKFTNGTTAPTTGTFQTGDICWNTNPQATSYVGWVCTASGTPGIWNAFGAISS